MCKAALRLVCLMLCFFLLVIVGGAFATWQYASQGPDPKSVDMPLSLKEFKYGMFYITTVKVQGGSYDSVSVSEVGDVDILSDITLTGASSSSVTLAVTFYNNTDVSYFYDKTETVSSDNSSIEYTVSGMAQKDEVPARTSATLYVTYSYSGSVPSDKQILSQLHFKFVIDKSSIGTIVAQTAVDRFRDILNNKVFDGAYQSLINGMDNRSGYNKASAITYIGNVSGSNSGDSALVNSLFGQEFMSMDLDGDGKAEPITMMIKRENLDGDETTGASYSYTSWGREYTVNGVEMTLYITSENLSSGSRSVVVYAVVFTKLPGATQWTDLVPLTKGTATPNNYSGFGSANSFNTDTWVSEDGKTIDELAVEYK